MFKLVNRMKNRKGFTLIELVVVIAILGILALVAIPRFAGIRGDAEDKAEKATAISVLNAAELYYVQTGNNPGSIGNLIPDYLRENPNPTGSTIYTLNGATDGDGIYTVTYPGGTVGSN